MKIRDIRATPVLVPLRRPLLHSNGTETGTARTIIELETDEGVVGIGETRGGASVAAMVAASRELWVGVDVLEAARIARRFGFYRVTSEQLHTVGAMKLAGAGIELACWDAAGQLLGKRVGDLWGGIERERIEFAAYAFYRYAEQRPGSESTIEPVVEHATELIETHGFRDVKVKNGVLDPEQELADIRRLRSELGSRMRHLRIDPNQVWSVGTAVRFLTRAAELDIEFCEDPVFGIEGMSRVNELVSGAARDEHVLRLVRADPGRRARAGARRDPRRRALLGRADRRLEARRHLRRVLARLQPPQRPRARRLDRGDAALHCRAPADPPRDRLAPARAGRRRDHAAVHVRGRHARGPEGPGPRRRARPRQAREVRAPVCSSRGRRTSSATRGSPSGGPTLPLY